MAEDDVPPPRIPPRLKSAPRIRQFYWCDLPRDAQLPELWKRRPVIVLSKRSTLFGAVTVVPCSTKEQIDLASVFQLKTSIDGRPAWAICDKIMTVAVSRLVPTHGAVARMPEGEFQEMLAVILGQLPKLPT